MIRKDTESQAASRKKQHKKQLATVQRLWRLRRNLQS